MLNSKEIRFFLHGGSNRRFSSNALTTRPHRHLGETVVSGTLPKIIIFFVGGIFYPQEEVFVEHSIFFQNQLVTVP